MNTSSGKTGSVPLDPPSLLHPASHPLFYPEYYQYIQGLFR